MLTKISIALILIMSQFGTTKMTFSDWFLKSFKTLISFDLNLLESDKLYLNYNEWEHSWHGFTENGPQQNIAQLWKLFSYIKIRILKIIFRNCVYSILSAHYKTFLFTGPFDLTKAQSL